MTTELDDCQIKGPLLTPDITVVRSISSNDLSITDDGDGNLTITAPSIAPVLPAVNWFHQDTWSPTGGSWDSETSYRWPARSGTYLIPFDAADLIGSGSKTVRISGTFTNTGIQDVSYSVITSTGTYFVGSPDYDTGLLTWFLDIDLIGKSNLQTLSWSSAGGWVPFTLDRVEIL